MGETTRAGCNKRGGECVMKLHHRCSSSRLGVLPFQHGHIQDSTRSSLTCDVTQSLPKKTEGSMKKMVLLRFLFSVLVFFKVELYRRSYDTGVQIAVHSYSQQHHAGEFSTTTSTRYCTGTSTRYQIHVHSIGDHLDTRRPFLQSQVSTPLHFISDV